MAPDTQPCYEDATTSFFNALTTKVWTLSAFQVPYSALRIGGNDEIGRAGGEEKLWIWTIDQSISIVE